MLELTKENFEKETGKGVVVLDFWAAWCGPCRMLGPVFEEISGEMKEYKFGKVNVDEQPELAQKFEVSSIPKLVIMKDGEVVSIQAGFAPKEVLKEWISSTAKG